MTTATTVTYASRRDEPQSATACAAPAHAPECPAVTGAFQAEPPAREQAETFERRHICLPFRLARPFVIPVCLFQCHTYVTPHAFPSFPPLHQTAREEPFAIAPPAVVVPCRHAAFLFHMASFMPLFRQRETSARSRQLSPSHHAPVASADTPFSSDTRRHAQIVHGENSTPRGA